MTAHQRIRSIVTAPTETWPARVYLAICSGLLVWVWVDSTFVQHEDASLAGAIPLLVTAPTSMLFMLLPEGPAYVYYPLVITAALINATLIGLIVRCPRRRARRPDGGR